MICEPNTVSVPSLMKVESYATVHQLVSVVQGHLNRGLTSIDAIKATFPPGSMTGAPKLRTVQILEELEGVPRGPYSGCLGFLSVNGCSDMSVVIRTAVCHSAESGACIEVGAGGAIVFMSNIEEEFDEMILKASSVLPSIRSVYNCDEHVLC
jgi:para-aminobenzoate synthetase